MVTKLEALEDKNVDILPVMRRTAFVILFAFAVHLLGNHPEVQAKVHEELDIVFGSDRERPVTDDDMKQLTYLECVIKEALRLYPPTPIIARDIDQDIKAGIKFAQLEDKILLAHLMRSFKVVSKIPMKDVQLSLELTLRPANGLWVTLIPRAAQ
ncbi:hypothetical protein HPB47_011419 [Ixodes persulcatus]|uniref:Uncharacterized protein n=1 Tax=Ixodes persulcatus TaxID=34615 RepID=A0AC60NX80_IXOPE|nr:hypothetical protein HPB47_011419 [Ixodes persulcatus]